MSKLIPEKLRVNNSIFPIIVFTLFLFFVIHLCGCFWFLAAKLSDLSPDCWVVRLGYIDLPIFDLYLLSYYWALTTITTVGYGDITPRTTLERMYSMVIMLLGILLISFLICIYRSLVSSMVKKQREINEKLDVLKKIKKEFNLGKDIYEKVRKVIEYGQSKDQKEKMNFLRDLPNKMRIELSQIMQDSLIQNLYFFKDQPSDFFAYVTPFLKPAQYSQNDYVYNIDDFVEESKIRYIHSYIYITFNSVLRVKRNSYILFRKEIQ